jgi:hypothetical protein
MRIVVECNLWQVHAVCYSFDRLLFTKGSHELVVLLREFSVHT